MTNMAETDPISRGLTSGHTATGIRKLKFNYPPRRARIARRFHGVFPALWPRKTSGEIASPIHGIPDDRREMSPHRNDRNNLPLSFASCPIRKGKKELNEKWREENEDPDAT